MGLDWATDADIAAGDCEDEWSLQAFLTRQLGVLAGLDFEWDTDDPLGFCDTTASTVDYLDVYALTVVYGTPTLLACSPAAEDTMAVQCHVSEPEGVTATWDFGDGEVVEGDVVSHTYAAEGRFVVKGCVELEGCDRPTCVTFDATARPGGVVTRNEAEQESGTCATAPMAPAWGALMALSLSLRRRRPHHSRRTVCAATPT